MPDSSVDLPLPTGPTTATSCPVRTFKVTSDRVGGVPLSGSHWSVA